MKTYVFIILAVLALAILYIGINFGLRQFDIYNTQHPCIKYALGLLIPTAIALALAKLMPD